MIIGGGIQKKGKQKKRAFLAHQRRSRPLPKTPAALSGEHFLSPAGTKKGRRWWQRKEIIPIEKNKIMRKKKKEVRHLKDLGPTS